MALNSMGVSDVTGAEIVDSLPAHLENALFPLRFSGEMERTVRNGGVCVVVVEECGGEEVDAVVGFFGNSMFVGAENVTLIGTRMTRIIMRVSVSSSSSS
ncbi:S-ADENOSYL-L-METHIONINE-DEPENDENT METHYLTRANSFERASES SUPERFAMILY PROTEIN [Salix purpurea]|uniref:S-ADENOSYL-L-METHIONINE-DEPENDENT METHYLTRANSFERASES SUPERFAMILY PROTEIN n=1 Tax=Salix purpurea TaxID=77065 RepID=A0A9Q0ZSK3_SALPP|nr:S-ADENOSYL-L-METHIONINE-DEPENDENT METHYLTRANSFERASES SUPERFAMILY PROTEIN [Salix purpurea]